MCFSIVEYIENLMDVERTVKYNNYNNTTNIHEFVPKVYRLSFLIDHQWSLNT